ncbi:recombination protein RecR [Dethiosulfovibrio peptidovorans DSM 11002]|uniref:Recombination protein RecR n=1 Tax=Dethiosulfovibrio peptidovorans DSM 11002 TaxID=469381 RepID=D2Z3X5_9BACT|nr:recombination mediator RecR [Dethiosulfovibrio peptidovorans]EFC92236.1 recombination protein RecR [Dethiosulfovibrio peptidovorans DSM 11002]
MALPGPFERLIGLLKRLPGVGEKSARRMAFFVFQAPEGYSIELADAFLSLKKNLSVCEICGNLTDRQPCNICSDPLRDRSTLCVVEGIEDLLSIEQAGVYDGLYYVLGGTVSPLDGEDLPEGSLDGLINMIERGRVSEVIVATNPRVEGDMTYHAVLSALKGMSDLKKSRLSYGLPVGGSIEFADRVTLHAAMETRIFVSGED